MVTVKDIAKASGVSPSTVSIILNGKSQARKISDKTCQKVWDAVRTLGYQPNIAARTLRDGHGGGTRTIALFWANDFRTSMLSRFLKGLESVRDTSGAENEIVVFTYANDQLCRQSALLSGKRFHAAIIANASEKDMEFIDSVVFPMPVVLYNRQSPGYYSVTVDNEKMGRLAAEAFITRGRRHPWVITSADVFPGMSLRIDGFIETLKTGGIASGPEQLRTADNSLESGAAIMHEILASGQPCDSVFCLSDAIAHGVLYELHRSGKKIPEDISVISIGNGDSEYSQFSIPPLTNVYLPMEEMAAHCLTILQNLLEHEEIPQRNMILDTPLILRES